ncbi:MAG: D-aminoacyl-tRNA deacylase [Rhodobacteraceae bacterium]|nr:D-aminoacyl-tRNA deacylase [Paracoccaceae bacterium]
MLCLIQRVKSAEVLVQHTSVATIGSGLLVFVCALSNDDSQVIEHVSKKIVNMRIFRDNNAKMNLSVNDIGGEILAVSQFTLSADLSRGNRPGFSKSAPPEYAMKIFDELVQQLQKKCPNVKTGQFGSEMEVSLINDGPVTIWLSYP